MISNPTINNEDVVEPFHSRFEGVRIAAPFQASVIQGGT
jgi:hypothetical protein